MEVSSITNINDNNNHHDNNKNNILVADEASAASATESDAAVDDAAMVQQQQQQPSQQHDDENNQNKDDNTNLDNATAPDAAIIMEADDKNETENSINDPDQLSAIPEMTTADVESTMLPQNGSSTTNGEAAADDMDIENADDVNEASESADDDAEMTEAAAGDDAEMSGNADETTAPQGQASAAAAATGISTDATQDTAEEAKENAAMPSMAVPAESAVAAAKMSATTSESNTTTTAAATVATDTKPAAEAPVAQLPVMKGTLCYEEDSRRHLIRGMWNYENSTLFPPQRFELVRTLAPDEDLKKLPQDGEFHGSFSLMYTHVTSKGKKKERSKVISESGVKITFTKQDDGSFLVDGKGTNQFGVFFIQGTAMPNDNPVLYDPTFSVELRKRYEGVAVPVATTNDGSVAAPAIVAAAAAGSAIENPDEPLPPPSESFPTGIVCLQGKLVKEETIETLGVTEVVYKINGMWAAGLNFLTDGGPTNRFEYEHKSSSANNAFPVSGRYSGWFDLTNDDGSRTRINERDVMLKFRKNNAGGYNVEGRGTNVFGKYNITGTLSAEPESVLTIFRHFQPRKIKTKTSGAVAPAAPGAQPAAVRRPSLAPTFDPVLCMDDVETPPEAENGLKLEPIVPPASGTYSAVSRGVLRVNDDGTHTCSGKWSATREHFTNGQTSSFSFRLESHLAKEPASNSRPFPLDSDRYKGSFQLKKQGARYQNIVDQQVVMKFRLNSQGSYNVYGKGVNPIGRFNLLGTLVMSGKAGGQVELYRMYPPEQLAVQPAHTNVLAPAPTAAIAKPETSLVMQPSTASLGTAAQRRESTRLVKLPSKLEDDDPDALLSRTMSKCAQILRAVREKDTEMGNFFAEPVDPVALGIPSYHQIVKEPMDLRTIHRRMETTVVVDPDEFARLVRLVFQNAMTFNVDPAHSVHQAARNLLVFFNQRFREVERIMVKITDEEKAKKGKDDKKRKRDGEPPKSLKRMRLEEAQALATANASFFAEIVSSVPANSATVSRTEFNMLLGHIQQLSRQLVDTHQILAELSPGDDNDVVSLVSTVPATVQSSASVASSVPERKKAPKRKSDTASAVGPIILEDSKPLTEEEQELLAENIGSLPPEELTVAIQIIQESTPVEADAEDLDLDLEVLDVQTQRKLFRHVMKCLKKSKAKLKKKPKTAGKTVPVASTNAPAPAKPAAVALPKPDSSSFFAFGSKGEDSDSDFDDEDGRSAPAAGQYGGKQLNNNAAKEFRLGDSLGDLVEDNDDDAGNGTFAANWSIPEAESEKGDDQEEDDDAWGAARAHAAIAKQREADRKAREEKMKAEAEIAKAQRLRDAAARGEEIKAQRAEEEEKDALLREQQEKDAEAAAMKAREAMRAQTQSVAQTVDLDHDRNIMKQYEQSFLDKDLGSASPSSDFGF